jgi:hypothetical protein
MPERMDALGQRRPRPDSRSQELRHRLARRGALLRRRGVLGRHRDVAVAVVWGAVLEPVAVPEEGAVGGEVAVGRWSLAFLPAEKSGNGRSRSGFLTEGAISEWWIVTSL